MKKAIGLIAATAFAIAAIGAPAAAANPNACFGQVHKAVNTDAATQELLGVSNVGQLVQALEGKGQGKNAAAKTFC